MRFLCIDPGDRRTGLAVGDEEVGQAGPAGVIESADPGEVRKKIADAIDEHGPDALVVGIPYNMDGSEGPAAKQARSLMQQLARETGLPVHAMDERLTSFEADELMKQSGLTHKQKKARRDALAAVAILRDFLRRRGDAPSE